jgi:hypothetical protein
MDVLLSDWHCAMKANPDGQIDLAHMIDRDMAIAE